MKLRDSLMVLFLVLFNGVWMTFCPALAKMATKSSPEREVTHVTVIVPEDADLFTIQMTRETLYKGKVYLKITDHGREPIIYLLDRSVIEGG